MACFICPAMVMASILSQNEDQSTRRGGGKGRKRRKGKEEQ